jgi:hypothetical protein
MDRLTQALLRQIEQQRRGEDVDSSLLKKVIDSYGELSDRPLMSVQLTVHSLFGPG